MAIEAVLFDLFDTLVRFDRERLPEVVVDGRRVRTTAGQLLPILTAWAPAVTLDALYAALLESWREAERQRALDDREVTAAERFVRLLQCLDLDPAASPSDLIPTLIETHRRGIARAAEFPACHATLLADLRPRYRLAVISNFDYAPTARAILADAGVTDLLAAIVVSDEVGWRKPAPAIFEAAFKQLGLGAADALFVGDRADIDVLGAQRVGMRSVWLNPGVAPLPSGVAPPDHEIRALDELRAIVGLDGASPGPALASNPRVEGT